MGKNYLIIVKKTHFSGRWNGWENDEWSVYVHFCNRDERILRRIPWKS